MIFPERHWPRIIGLISGMFGISTLIGPAIGGIFAEYGAWRVAFWFLQPFLAILVVLAYLALPKRQNWPQSKQAEHSSIPYLQLLLLTTSVLMVSMGSLSPELLWNMLGLLAALLLIALIAWIDQSAKARLLPKRALNIATPLGALYLMIALLMISMQLEIFVPYWLQVLHHQSPLAAGYIGAVMSLGWGQLATAPSALKPDRLSRACAQLSTTSFCQKH